MSVYSRTTTGGANFDLLCEGDVRNYSFNPAKITAEKKVKHIKHKLVKKLKDTIRALQIGSSKKIAKIYIGKTFIQQRRKPGGGFKTFDPLDHHTWRKNGISSRWSEHKNKEYGRDGLVVLCAITRKTVPKKCRDRLHQEDFTLAMEQKLLHHCIISHPDPRVVNETFTAGQAPKRNHYAYAVYMAFRYADNDTATDDGNGESPHKDNVQDEPNDPSLQTTDDGLPSALNQQGPSHAPPSQPFSAFSSFSQTEPVPISLSLNPIISPSSSVNEQETNQSEQNTELQPHSSDALYNPPSVHSCRERKTLPLRQRKRTSPQQLTTSSPQRPCTSTTVQRLPFTEQTAETGTVSLDVTPGTSDTSNLPTNQEDASPRQSHASPVVIMDTTRQTPTCIVIDSDCKSDSSSSTSTECSLVNVPEIYRQQDSPPHSSPVSHSDSLNRQEMVLRYLASLSENDQNGDEI